MAFPKTGIDKLDGYCESVMTGEQPVNKWVRLAVERHYRDLERQGTEEFPYYFDKGLCLHYVNFFQDELKHFDGVFAGKPIIFEPWQYFAWGSAFGWIELNTVYDIPIRRFSELIIIIPKKQGKSIIIAGTMIYMVEEDNYPGAQIYALATSQSHAKTLGYRDAEKMIEKNDRLKETMRVNHSAGDRGIYCDPMGSFIKPQTSKPESSDGLKVHMVANDEIKDWIDFEIYDTMADGTSTDPNSLIANITTAGEKTESLGYERQRYLEKILDGRLVDEKTFGVIYGIDPEDREKWDTLEVARKANPNFGVTVPASYYEERIKKAKNSKRSKAVYLTKQLNEWGHSVTGWLDVARWDKIADPSIKPADFSHLPAILCLDLSSKIDLSELKLLFFEGFDVEKVKFTCFSHFYVPEARLHKTDDQKSDAYRSQLVEWEDQGWITVAGEETIDYDRIKRDIKAFNDKFDIVKMSYDPWNAQQTINDLQKDGFPEEKMIEYTQTGYKNWSEPMKQTEVLIFEERLKHEGNPVQRWCMGNVGYKENEYNSIRPAKVSENEKIDGAVTLIMGIGTHMYAVEEHDSNLSPAARRAMAKINQKS